MKKNTLCYWHSSPRIRPVSLLVVLVLFGCGPSKDEQAELEPQTQSAQQSKLRTETPVEMQAREALRRGITLVREGKSSDALADFSEAIRLDPKCAEAYYNRSKVYGLSSTAITDLTKAIRLNPKYAEAYFQRGHIYFARFQSEKAMIHAIPFDLALLESGGTTRDVRHCHLAEFDKAIGDFTDAIRLKPDYADAYYNRGLVYRTMGEYEEGISDCTEATLSISEFNWTYYDSSMVFVPPRIPATPDEARELIEDSDNAIADFPEAIRLYSRTADAYYSRGCIYDLKGERWKTIDDYFDDAIADFSEAVRLNSSSAEAYYNRGCIYDLKGEREKAIDDYRQTVDINRKHAKAYIRLGRAWLENNAWPPGYRAFAVAKALGCKPPIVHFHKIEEQVIPTDQHHFRPLFCPAHRAEEMDTPASKHFLRR